MPRRWPPTTTARKMHDFLLTLPEQPDGPYVHPKTISFGDGKERTNWQSHLHRDNIGFSATVSEFWCAKKDGKATWLGVFSCPSANWVQNNSVEKSWVWSCWHCFAVAIIADPDRGKHLVVWDCDPKPGADQDTRIPHALNGLQTKLWKYARRQTNVVGL